jgi:hypothetical protein
MAYSMRGTSNTRRQATIIGVVLVAAVAVPKALAGDPVVVPVDGAALAAVAITASTPVVPQAPPAPIVPETGAVSPVSPVIPPTVSPQQPFPPTPGSPAGTPQSLAGEPAGDSEPAGAHGVSGTAPAEVKNPADISSGITEKHKVILARKAHAKRPQNLHEACSQKASCKAPEPYPRGAAAAPTRGGVRESPSLGVTVAELARGRAAHHDNKPAHAKQVHTGGAGGVPAPLIPAPPGRSPEAPPPSSLTSPSPGAHGTGNVTVSASVTAFGVAAARAPTTAARSTSVPLRRRESDKRIDRPG